MIGSITVIKYSVTSLVEKLIDEDKNILILDTCCLLDVVRCIQRENLSELKSTIEIIDLFEKNQNKFVIVLSSLINTEWSDNITLVLAETKNHVEKCDIAHRNLINSLQMISPSTLESVWFSQYNLETILSGFSHKLLNLSFHLDNIKECESKAINRVVMRIPPAAQGKDSIKDCLIFEETIFLCNLLRSSGFSKKIVFSSSNTREYYRDRKPISQIADELKKSNTEIVTSLSHGYHLTQKDESF